MNKKKKLNNFLLIELSKKFSFPQEKIFLTTKSFSHMIGFSQQSASRYLQYLALEGLINREVHGNGEWVEFTEKGIDNLNKIYEDLDMLFSFKQMKLREILKGNIISGLGEGAYYVNVYRDYLERKLKFAPYPGTLNIRLVKQSKGLERYITRHIPDFSKDGRTFGGLAIIPISNLSRKKEGREKEEKIENSFIILPKRTHHEKDILEVIHKENLREKYDLKDGDDVTIEVSL